VDKRVGTTEFYHDVHHHDNQLNSQQPVRRFQDDRKFVASGDVVVQRTMIRNPEDAFTQTIQTNFQCPRGRPGYYADIQNECRVFHICHEYSMPNGEPHSVRYSQFCPPGTVFDQLTLTCNFVWAAVPCGSANQFFYVNSNLYQPDVHFISDDDVQRSHSLNPARYRAYKPERYVSYVPARPVTTTKDMRKTMKSYPALDISYTPPATSDITSYEKSRYISRPAVAYDTRSNGGRIRYDTHTLAHHGGHVDVHVERNLGEAKTTQYLRSAPVGERLVVESPRTQNVIITSPVHTRSHVHTHRSEIPKVSVHPSQVRFSTYAPHMGFLGFIPDQHYTTISSQTFPYSRGHTSGSTFQSFESHYQSPNHVVIPNTPVLSPKELPRLDTPFEHTQPPRYIREYYRSYKRNHMPSVPFQRPLIPASEFPGFKQNNVGFRNSLSIQHIDPHTQNYSRHHNYSHETVASISPTSTPQQRPLPAVPVVPVTAERRPSATSGRNGELVEEVVIDKARRPVLVALQQYDLRQAHDSGRRVKSRTETTEFIQEPVTIHGGRRSKTLFPSVADEVPYLKRTARSHREFVEPAFKRASAIPGVIPQEYFEYK
ncbi:cuticular protein-like, partial [Tropilaelaps mercedesae]